MKNRQERQLTAILMTAASLLIAAAPQDCRAAVPAKGPVANAKAPETNWRQKAPALPQPHDLQLPQPTTYTLGNGLKVVLLEDHRVPFITFQLAIQGGTTLDPLDKLGLASTTADMLNEGTASKTSKQLAEQVDFIGGALKAYADTDFSVISGSALSEYKDKLFDLATDCLLNPVFPEDELKLEKTNLIQELTLKRAQPEFLLSERFNKVVFGDHPYSVVAPTADTVSNIHRDDLKAFHDNNYLPNKSVLVVVGDFKNEEMKALIEKDFASWKTGETQAQSLPGTPQQKGRRIYLVDRPGSVQSSVKIGNLGIQRSSPDYFPLLVANQILGGSPNSRLFTNIREQKGYTYGAYSSFVPRVHPGEFAASANVRTAVTGPSLEEFFYELDRIRNLKPTDAEVSSAKNYLIGSFQLGLETQSGLAQRLLEQQIYNLPADYLANYNKQVLAITPEDVRRAARNHIDLDNVVVTVVGNAKELEPELEYFGPVEVFDASGKLMHTDEAKAGSEKSQIQ